MMQDTDFYFWIGFIGFTMLYFGAMFMYYYYFAKDKDREPVLIRIYKTSISIVKWIFPGNILKSNVSSSNP